MLNFVKREFPPVQNIQPMTDIEFIQLQRCKMVNFIRRDFPPKVVTVRITTGINGQ